MLGSELLNGNYRIALLAQKLLIRRPKNDSAKFTPQQLGTILGMCSDKAIALLKATKDLETEAGNSGKSIFDPDSDYMKEVRDLQRRRVRASEKREREEKERQAVSDRYRL